MWSESSSSLPSSCCNFHYVIHSIEHIKSHQRDTCVDGNKKEKLSHWLGWIFVQFIKIATAKNVSNRMHLIYFDTVLFIHNSICLMIAHFAVIQSKFHVFVLSKILFIKNSIANKCCTRSVHLIRIQYKFSLEHNNNNKHSTDILMMLNSLTIPWFTSKNRMNFFFSLSFEMNYDSNATILAIGDLDRRKDREREGGR